MKTLKLLMLLLITLSIPQTSLYAEEEKDIKIRAYWHVYNEDKNNPIKNMSVYIQKNWSVLWNWKTSKEWLYDIITDNRSDYLNLCIESNSFSSLKGIKYCVTVSAFQEIWREIDGIEIREIEYDFYTNSKWENLNELYEEEITNQTTEDSFNQYEETILKNRDIEEVKIAEEVKLAELEKKKTEYKMVSNTEMTWPLEAIQIIWTVKTNSWTIEELDYNRTYVIISDHYWNKLKEEKLNKYYDFNITVRPKQNTLFLHPINLKIENRQFTKIKWESIAVYEASYKLITKEKNIFNIVLDKKQFNEFNETKLVKEKFPILSIISILCLVIISIILIINNRIYTKRNDY